MQCPCYPVLYPSYPVVYPSYPELYPYYLVLYPSYPALDPSYPVVYPYCPVVYPYHPVLYPEYQGYNDAECRERPCDTAATEGGVWRADSAMGGPGKGGRLQGRCRGYEAAGGIRTGNAFAHRVDGVPMADKV